MKKELVNELYGYIAVAFFFIFVVDILLRLHPIGNIVGGFVLLSACYHIGRATK